MSSLFLHYRRLSIVIFHAATIVLSLNAAFWLRFDLSIPDSVATMVRSAYVIALAVKLAVFILSRLHRGSWRFVSIIDLYRVVWANIVASLGFTAATMILIGPSFPRSIYLIDFLVCFVGTAGARFSFRLYNEAVTRRRAKPGAKGILIYGAGAAGRMLVREILANRSMGYKVIGFLDDHVGPGPLSFMNIPVLGAGRDAAVIVDRFKGRTTKIAEIIIAMPSATGRQMREAVANCRAAGVPCKTLPGIGELLNGQILSAQIRNLSLDDLLGRKQVRLEEDKIARKIAGRTVLITGAAGSIGSELCRQTAGFGPAKLIAFDQAESDLYRIDLELRDKYPNLDIVAELGSIRDVYRIEKLMRDHQVDSVFHAAAYKHVPMMETHVLEAIETNVLGTWNLVRACSQNHVSDFLMISSDKAVNPTSVMGLTKRIAELLVSASSENGSRRTNFVSVRFGNVLGSNGSVVPLFQSQIAAGGPVTVTHPDMRRYFMTVREAVQLVLQATTMGNGSEIFVLDMGEPVRIMDLAHNMIRLAGFVPGEDIEIRVTGLRPGEKLFEELMLDGEDHLPTYHEKIKIFKGTRLSEENVEDWIRQLRILLEQEEPSSVVSHLRRLVPEYQPATREVKDFKVAVAASI